MVCGFAPNSASLLQHPWDLGAAHMGTRTFCKDRQPEAPAEEDLSSQFARVIKDYYSLALTIPFFFFFDNYGMRVLT